MLAIPAYKRPLDSLEDILRASDPNSKYRFYVKNNSISQKNFIKATPTENSLYYAIGRKVNATPDAAFPHQSHVAKLLDASEYNVIFSDRIGTLASSFVHLNSPIHLGRENYDNSLVGFVFPKKSPLMGPFNVVIRHLREMGIINRLIEQVVDKSVMRLKFRHIRAKFREKEDRETDDDVKVFSLVDFQSIFTITSVGVLIALLTFTIECLGFCFVNIYNKLKTS